MSSSKALSSRQMTPLVSRVLKIIGIIITLAALLDVIIVPLPWRVLDRQWQINFVTLTVDRGIVPLVGLGLILIGYWVESVAGIVKDSKPWKSLGFWALVLSSIIGLYFLLVFPLHLNNIRINNTEAIERISQQAQQSETQLTNQLQAQIGQQRQQIEQLLANPTQLDQALESGQLPEDQASLLQRFRQNPAELDTFIEQRTTELQQQVQTRVGIEREQALQAAKTESLKSGLRIGITSVLMAIAYIAIGWLGLRSWGQGNQRV